MRIAFDASCLRAPQTGVGFYAEHLLRHLAARPDECELILISNRTPETSAPLPATVRVAEGRRFRFRSVWLQTHVPRLLRETQPDLAHFTNAAAPLRKRFPTVATIHDMSLTLFPQFHPARRRLTRPLVYRTALTANRIIAVSQSARRDISRLTGVSESKIDVVYEAAAPEFRRVEDATARAAIRRKYGLDFPFVLFVGTLEPRKNLPALVAAFSRLKTQGDHDHRLVLAGSPGWGRRQLRRQVRKLAAKDHVLEIGYVPYADLPGLYSLAEAFVFPSLHEGFGLPILEAMSCGTPVVASNVSSMEEIAGGAVESVDPLDPDSIRAGLKRVLESPQRRAELSHLGIRRSREFSWERAAAETLDVYRSALSGARA